MSCARLTTRWSRPGQPDVDFGAKLVLAGRAAHLEAVRHRHKERLFQSRWLPVTTLVRKFLRARSKAFLFGASLVLVAAIGFADYLTGYHLSLGLFYVAPISLVSWYVSRPAGFMFAFLSALVWYSVNSAFAPLPVTPSVIIWNTIVRLGFFIIICSLLASLKEAYARQSDLARTDPLTGLLNSRAFVDEATLELARATRNKYEITTLYFDLDNFKALNDSRGHAAGDSLLRDIGNIVRSTLRSTDIIGRLGGDEFAILLSASSRDHALSTANRLQAAIHRVSSQQEPSVTVTLGAVTSNGSEGIESLIRRADHMMYQGKVTQKGSIRFDVTEGDA